MDSKNCSATAFKSGGGRKRKCNCMERKEVVSGKAGRICPSKAGAGSTQIPSYPLTNTAGRQKCPNGSLDAFSGPGTLSRLHSHEVATSTSLLTYFVVGETDARGNDTAQGLSHPSLARLPDAKPGFCLSPTCGHHPCSDHERPTSQESRR